MPLLEGNVTLITGGSRGIGEAIVREFVKQGAQVAFTYLSSAEKAQKIVEELQTPGVKIKAYQSDASSYDDSEDLIKKVLEDFGTIDTLINNAAITKDNLILRMSSDQWDQVITTNLKSAFNLTKHCLRTMLKKRKGSIINTSSVVGVFGNAGQANYAASKAGLIGFTKSVAKEIGSREIRCNTIAPGFVETDMTCALDEKARENFLNSVPLGRFGEAHEIANAAVFLATDMSTYVTGQVLSVCGGLNC